MERIRYGFWTESLECYRMFGVVHNGKEEEIFAKIEKLDNQVMLIKSRVKESKVSLL